MAGTFPDFERSGWGLDVRLGDERHVHGHRANMSRQIEPCVPAYLELVAPDRGESSVAELATMLEQVADLAPIGEPGTVARFLLEAERTGPVPSAPAELPGPVADWSHADLWLFSSVAHFVVDRACPVAVHSGRVLASPDVFVCVWVRTTPRRWDDLTGSAPADGRCPEPLPERVRRHSYRVELAGRDGHHELARLMQDVLQHHEWAAGQLIGRVEEWERRFYRAASSERSMFDGTASERFREDLAAIAEANLELRKVVRDLDRRARLDGLLSAPEEHEADLRDEVAERSAGIERRTEEIRDSVRDGFALLASAASGAQVELQQGFQVAAGLVAGLVLIPGLVLSLYGAAVAGLPGQGDDSGLVYAGAYSAIGAAATIAGLYLAHRRRWTWLTLVVALAVCAMIGVSLLR